MVVSSTEIPNTELAVNVTNATKRFDNQLVLKGINLRVDKGRIYGLLGPSGCGKTTLLSSIVGVQQLTHGRIELFGRDTRSFENGIAGSIIGYMPQEIALYESFTIRETFEYYGVLNGMSDLCVEENMDNLITILGLPDIGKYVGEISGGEKRRVSLAVSLLHNPQLLILDEPTVGVDPLLREQIWNYLNHLVQTKGISVLMTTHYVEETKNCARIGYLRDGCLIVEDTPSKLLEKFNASNLDDAILTLCKSPPPARNSNHLKYIQLNDGIIKEWKNTKSLANNSRCSITNVTDRDKLSKNFKRLKALTKRNWNNTSRYPMFFLAHFFPLMINIYMYIFALGNDPIGLQIGVVNHDQSPGIVQPVNETTILDWLPSRFTNHLKLGNLNMIDKTTELDALQGVRSGHISGYIVIPRNFSTHMKNRFLFNIHSGNDTLSGSSISVHLDQSEYMNFYFLQKTIYTSLQNLWIDVAKSYGVDERIVKTPLHFKAIYGDNNDTYNRGLMPTFLLVIIAFFAAAVAVFHTRDRTDTTLQRTLATGVKQYQIILSYFLTDLHSFLWQTGIVLFCIWWTRSEYVRGSWALIFLTFYTVRVSMMAMAFMLGSFCRKEIETLMVCLAVILIMVIHSDVVWPIEATIWWYRPFCYLFPLSNSVGMLRSVMTRGWGIAHPCVLLYGVCIPTIRTLIFLFCAIWIENRKI